MTRVLRFAHRVALAALLALVLAAPATACSCGPQPSVEDSRAASAAVFTGIPIAIGSNPGGNHMVTFQVTAVWKGTVPAEYSILTSDPLMCGVGFDLGTEWLVYAFPYDASNVHTYNCSRTARAAGNPDIVALGPPLTTPAVVGSWGLVKAIYR